jgi:hypothetical protein
MFLKMNYKRISNELTCFIIFLSSLEQTFEQGSCSRKSEMSKSAHESHECAVSSSRRSLSSIDEKKMRELAREKESKNFHFGENPLSLQTPDSGGV